LIQWFGTDLISGKRTEGRREREKTIWRRPGYVGGGKGNV